MVSLVLARVPPNWKHPVVIKDSPIWGKDHPHVVQMFPVPFDVALAEWEAESEAWKAGMHSDIDGVDDPSISTEDDPDRPTPENYAPWTTDEATWYQVWQDNGNGSPLTPPFENVVELMNYMVEFGLDYEVRHLGIASGVPGEPWAREEVADFMLKRLPGTLLTFPVPKF